jgi:hypothetical protein
MAVKIEIKTWVKIGNGYHFVEIDLSRGMAAIEIDYISVDKEKQKTNMPGNCVEVSCDNENGHVDRCMIPIGKKRY